MLFLKADNVNLARIEAPKPRVWNSIANIAKTTKVALGVFSLGFAVAASAVSFGAAPLIAGSLIALAGAGIYAYGKISQAIERKSYVKPIFKAPSEDVDFLYVNPGNPGSNAAKPPSKDMRPNKPIVINQGPVQNAAPSGRGKENNKPFLMPNPLAVRRQTLA